jgi:DNA-binding NarL/FixJ family response regulator
MDLDRQPGDDARVESPSAPVAVLIVDDAPAFRAAARDLLLSRGYVIAAEAADALEALAVMEHAAPDAVLLDVRLGGDDGFALAARLTSRWPAVAVLLTSATRDERYHRLATLNGARGFVPKQDLARADLAALLARPLLAEQAGVLSAGDGLGARRRTEFAIDAVGLRLDRIR